jgi:hypothetical protein
MNLALVKTTVSKGKTKKKQTTKTKKKTIESSIKEQNVKENNNCNVYLDLPPPYKRRTSFESSNASRLEKMKRFKMLQDVDALKTVLPSIRSSSNHNLNARSIARQSCTIERIAALERKLERFTLRLTQNERRLTHNERRLAQLEATR